MEKTDQKGDKAQCLLQEREEGKVIRKGIERDGFCRKLSEEIERNFGFDARI